MTGREKRRVYAVLVGARGRLCGNCTANCETWKVSWHMKCCIKKKKKGLEKEFKEV